MCHIHPYATVKRRTPFYNQLGKQSVTGTRWTGPISQQFPGNASSLHPLVINSIVARDAGDGGEEEGRGRNKCLHCQALIRVINSRKPSHFFREGEKAIAAPVGFCSLVIFLLASLSFESPEEDPGTAALRIPAVSVSTGMETGTSCFFLPSLAFQVFIKKKSVLQYKVKINTKQGMLVLLSTFYP